MLKLNASYSKKVPADGEYTSQSYHASIEIELPDGLSSEQLNSKIHETFEMVRNSVEAELHGNTPANYGSHVPQETQKQSPLNNPPASPKQINYLLTLASRRGIRIGAESQAGTRLPLPGIEFSQPRPGYRRSHPQRYPPFAKGYGGTRRTRNHHPFQTPQRLPGRLDRVAETVWDGVKKG